MSRDCFVNLLLSVIPHHSVSPFCTGSGRYVQSHPHFLRAIVYIHVLPHSTYLYGLDIYRTEAFSHQDLEACTIIAGSGYMASSPAQIPLIHFSYNNVLVLCIHSNPLATDFVNVRTIPNRNFANHGPS